MDTKFPKDCQASFPRLRAGRKVFYVLLALLFAGLTVDLFILGHDNHFMVFWLAGLALMVVGSFRCRCPACGGGLVHKLHPRFCCHCGSRLVSAPFNPEGDTMIAHLPDSTLGDGRTGVQTLEETPERWRFRFKPFWLLNLGLWAACLAILVFACDSLVVDGQRTQEGKVQIQVKHTLFGARLWSRWIQDVQSAQVEVGARTDGEEMYRVLLTTAGGSVPLTGAYTEGWDPHQQTANAINQLVHDTTQAQLIVTQKPGFGNWASFGFLFAVALGLLCSRADEFLMDLNAPRFQILRRGIGKPRLLEYEWDDIEQFGVARLFQYDHSDSSRSPNVHCVSMRLQSGAIVYLQRTAGPLGYRKQRAIGNRLENLRRSRQARVAASLAAQGQAASPSSPVGRKTCVVCGKSCADEARYRDAEDRYYHQACYNQATS